MQSHSESVVECADGRLQRPEHGSVAVLPGDLRIGFRDAVRLVCQSQCCVRCNLERRFNSHQSCHPRIIGITRSALIIQPVVGNPHPPGIDTVGQGVNMLEPSPALLEAF